MPEPRDPTAGAVRNAAGPTGPAAGKDTPKLPMLPLEAGTAPDGDHRAALARYACCHAPNLCGATCQDDEASWLLAWAHRQITDLEVKAAALTRALADHTHDYEPSTVSAGHCKHCTFTRSHRYHRTPERVLGGQETKP